MILKTPTATKKCDENFLSTVLETLLLHTAQMVLTPLEFMSQFSDAVIDNPGFLAPLSSLSRSEQLSFAVSQAKIGMDASNPWRRG